MKTHKGTELPLVNLKGKEYLQVAHRLVWFREDHADWSIETEFMESDAQHAVAKATIKDVNGRIIATSHKEESLKDFPAGYREKAETGAIGRALALCGYGTQFAPDLDEGERIVDSPVERPKAKINPSKPSPIKPKNETMAGFEERGTIVSLAQQHGWSLDQVKQFIKNKYKVDQVEQLTISQAAFIADTIEEKMPQDVLK